MAREKDKIFDNNFGERNFESGSMTFKLDSSFADDIDAEELIHRKILYDKIHALIELSEFKKLNELDENGDHVKLNKVQINKVYGYITARLNKGYKKIELWSIVSEYFDIYPAKFYSSLSNIYKHDLLEELDKSIDFLKKHNIEKLY